MRTTHRFVLTDEYIAEAQRLSIAQNKTLKFLYQTWWSRWLPPLALIGFIIFCVVNHFDWSVTGIFGALLLITLLADWLGQRSLAKARKRTRFKGSTVTVSMDENGVDIVGQGGNSHGKWSGILPPAVYPNGVLFKVSRFAVIWLADQALTEGSPEDVRKLLKENVKQPAGGE